MREPPPLAVRCVLFSVDRGVGYFSSRIWNHLFSGASPTSPPAASEPASESASEPASEPRFDSKQTGGGRGRSFRSHRQPRCIVVVYSAKHRGAVFWSASCCLLHLLRPMQLETNFPYFSRAEYGPNYSILFWSVVADHLECGQKRALRIPPRALYHRSEIESEDTLLTHALDSTPRRPRRPKPTPPPNPPYPI